MRTRMCFLAFLALLALVACDAAPARVAGSLTRDATGLAVDRLPLPEELTPVIRAGDAIFLELADAPSIGDEAYEPLLTRGMAHFSERRCDRPARGSLPRLFSVGLEAAMDELTLDGPERASFASYYWEERGEQTYLFEQGRAHLACDRFELIAIYERVSARLLLVALR